MKEASAIEVLNPSIIYLCERLSRCPGVIGVVLGGSRARRKATPTSDVDLGLFYEPGAFDWEAVAKVLRAADCNGQPKGLSPPGTWGPWMNGGGWLSVEEDKVDVLLRDIGFVKGVLRDVQAGIFSSHYLPGHPHGWHSFMMAGEVSHNVPLNGDIAALNLLQASISEYPVAMRQTIYDRFSYEARFSAVLLKKLEKRNDPAQVKGLAYRGLMCLAHIICALNSTFVTNEKGLLREASEQPHSVHNLFYTGSGLLNSTTAAHASDVLTLLLGQVNGLAEELCSFRPFWNENYFPHE